MAPSAYTRHIKTTIAFFIVIFPLFFHGIGKYKNTFLTTETSYGKFFIPPFALRQAQGFGGMKFLAYRDSET
jgi:hypothetical protein